MLALQLFNDNGTLDNKHRTHPWGSELNSRAILVISYLIVEKEYRKMGIARMLIDTVIEKAKKAKGGLSFMFVKPGVIKDDFGKECAELPEDEQKRVTQRAFETAVRF